MMFPCFSFSVSPLSGEWRGEHKLKGEEEEEVVVEAGPFARRGESNSE
jgi:hypothetical protein